MSSALYKLFLLSEKEKRINKALKVKAFLITDGRANVSLFGRKIRDELIELSKSLNKIGVDLTIYEPKNFGIILSISYTPLIAKFANAKIYRV